MPLLGLGPLGGSLGGVGAGRNGRKFAGVFKYGLHSGAATSASSAYLNIEYYAQLKGYYIEDVINMLTGFSLTMILEDGTVGRANGSTTLAYDGPNAPYGGLVFYDDSFIAGAYIDVYFDVVVYGMDNQLLKLVCRSVKVDLNGTMVDLGSFHRISTGLGPAYLPICGGLYSIESYVTSGSASFPYPTYDIDIAGTFPIEGGYTFQREDSGIWEVLPISLPPSINEGAPQNTCSWTNPSLQATRVFGSGSGPYGLSAVSPTIATQSWGDVMEAKGRYRYALSGGGTGAGPNGLEYGTFIEEFETIQGGCMFYPDTAKSWGFFEPDTARDLAYAFRNPEVETSWSRGFHTLYNTQGPGGSSESNYSSIGSVPPAAISPAIGILGPMGSILIANHQFDLTGTTTLQTARAGELASIDSGGSRIDDQFGTVYSWPWSSNNHYYGRQDFDYSTTPDTITNDQRQETVGYGGLHWANYVCDTGAVANTTLDHSAYPIRFYHSPWVSPGWNTMFHAEDWPLMGSSVWRESYWKEGGIQWYANASLEPADIDYTRSDDVLTAVGSVNEFQPWIDHYYGFKRDPGDEENTTGTGMDWLGNPGTWYTEQVNIPSSYTYDADSSSLFTIPDGSGSISFGAGGISITPSSGSVDLTMRLGSWTVEPFMLPHIMELITVDWALPVGASCQLIAKGYDGKETVLGTTSGTYRLGQGSGDKTAGTWVVSNEIDSGVPTDGADVLPSGISLSAVSDPELYTCFSLLHGHSPYKIIFRLSGVPAAQTVEIDWPILSRSGHWRLVWMNRQVCALIDTFEYESTTYSGPVILFGATMFFDPMMGWLNPPMPQALGFKPSVVDGLAFINLWLLGKSETFGVTTRLLEIFDDFEGQSPTLADRGTMAIPLPHTAGNPLAFAFINTCSTFPTMPYFPPADPDTATWLQDGSPVNKIWLWGINPRQVISNDYPVTMQTDTGTPVASASTELVGSNWHITKFRFALTNSESSAYKLFWNGTQVAEISPWFGYNSAIWIPEPSSARNPTIEESPEGWLFFAFVEDGNLKTKTAYSTTPADGWAFSADVLSSGDCSFPRLMRDQDGRIWLSYTRTSSGTPSGYVQVSDDNGRTWRTATMPIANCKYLTHADGPHRSVVGVGFVYDSGTSGPGKLYAVYRDPGSSAFGAAFTLKDSAGTPLSVEDDTFGFRYCHEGAGRWLLSVRLAGDTAESWFVSAQDRPETWKGL